MQLLVVEDDPAIAHLIQRGLSELGYTVEAVPDADAAERALSTRKPQLVILDVMLPGRSGVEFCKTLRERGVGSPVLMLTALSSTRDKVGGLEAGADDYLAKPFEFAELAARVKALLRRGRSAEPSVLRYDDLEMDLLRRQVVRAGKPVRLTPKEFTLLEYFLRHPEQKLTRAQIGENVWEADFEYGGNVIEVYVSALRRKVDRGFARPLIHTIFGVGYVLKRDPHAE
jgi:DNA-binding response OmpR family regulator